MYVNYRFELTKRLGVNEWDTSNPIVIDEFAVPTISVRTGDERGSFSFDLDNFKDFWSENVNPRDIITVSRVINTDSFSSEDVLLTGLVNNSGVSIGSDENLLKVEGFDYSDTIMSAITFVDSENLRVDEMFVEALNIVNTYAPQFGVEWDDDNPSLNSQGEPFPVVGKKLFNISMREALLKYSGKNETGDGNYYWYVTPDRKLVWRQSSQSIDFTFDYVVDDYLELKDGKDTKDVVNFVIIKGGRDPTGKQVQTFVQDLSSIGRHGQRFKIVPEVARDAEYLNKQDMDSLGITEGRFPESYPFTTTWRSLAKIEGGVPQFVEVGDSGWTEKENREDYVKAIRDHTLLNIRRTGRDFIDTRKFGKYELQISFLPGKGWRLGNLVDVVNYPFPDRTSSKTLRVVGIDYGVDIDTYFLSEDEGTI